MLRDAIVIGTCNTAVRERCLKKGDKFTFDIAVNIGHSYETFQDSLKMKAADEDPKGNVVSGAASEPHRSKKVRPPEETWKSWWETNRPWENVFQSWL